MPCEVGFAIISSEVLRFVEAEVEINGKKEVLTFISNNLEWAASVVSPEFVVDEEYTTK